ncbi:hypothetical protein HDU88_005082 [Geranomyces variabilis]|nr:hypothetical protein HDU88_005082 [Geranomyces variabilis]
MNVTRKWEIHWTDDEEGLSLYDLEGPIFPLTHKDMHVSVCGLSFIINAYYEYHSENGQQGWHVDLNPCSEIRDDDWRFSLRFAGADGVEKTFYPGRRLGDGCEWILGDDDLPENLFASITVHCKTLPNVTPANHIVTAGFNDKNLSDVVIEYDNGRKKLHVSKSILSASSNYFRHMFDGKYVESAENVVKIMEIDPDVLERCISWIYTGEIPLDSETEPLTVPLIAKFHHAADRLLISSLADRLRKHLQEWSLTEPNSTDLYEFALAYDDADLKAKIWQFWCDGQRTISSASSKAFIQDLTRDELKELLDGIILHSQESGYMPDFGDEFDPECEAASG